MFLELKENTKFKEDYFDLIKYRLAYGSLEIEGINEDLANAKQSMKIFNQLQAINTMFDKYTSEKLNHFEFMAALCEIANKVTGGEVENFRTTSATVNGSNVKRTSPQLIRNDLLYLIDNYNWQIDNCKSEDELYEIEAQFHIRLLHIHPFEDGNGRTARIFLAYNMCKHSLAPCIITKEMKREYCDFIENNDSKGLASLFKKLSENELNVMINLYKELDANGLIENNKMSKEQEEELKKFSK